MKRRLRVLSFLPVIAFALLAPLEWRANERKSELGVYEGYSTPIYSEWIRNSEYITVSDGTKLAADIFRPARNNTPVSEPLPAIWIEHRYRRAFSRDGSLVTELDQQPWLQTMVQHGYVVAAVDVRGSGASFGTWSGPYQPREATDGYDVTEWLAKQPWCNGKVGMFGRSYMAANQFLAAGKTPPHLKAIFPEMPTFDLYSSVYSGGIFRQDYVANWDQKLNSQDTDRPAVPVDDDQQGVILGKAVRAHNANANVLTMASRLAYRDSHDQQQNAEPYIDWNPIKFLPQINRSGVAIYQLSGWFDLRPRDALLWFNNLRVPQKLIIGPWFHLQSNGLDLGAERLRWFDYWLKGIDNGMMSGDPIHYYTIGASSEKAWRSTAQWPLPDQKLTSYYFQGDSGSGSAKNAGGLDLQSPSAAAGQNDYPVDYGTTTGLSTRWTAGYGGPAGYHAMTDNDGKALTYTTAPLVSMLEVTGHPIAHLWLSSTASDADVFVYLEDVDEQGNSRYVTEGALRASHRAVSEPVFNNIGLPYHRSFSADVKPLPSGEPVELVLDLSPISYVFNKGHRLRIALTGADKDNAQTIPMSPAPVITIYRNIKYASHVILPLIPIAADEASQPGLNQTEKSAVFSPSHLLQWRSLIILLTAMIVVTALIKGRKFIRHV